MRVTLLEHGLKLLCALLLENLELGERFVLSDFARLNASLMARIFVAHSALTSATSSMHFLTHGGLGPQGGARTVAAVRARAPWVMAGSLHAAVALEVLAVARGWTAEEEEHEQDDRQDLPACGRERERGLVRIWFQFCVFFQSRQLIE